MKQIQKKSSDQAVLAQLALKVTPIAAACLMLVGAVTVQAQEAPATDTKKTQDAKKKDEPQNVVVVTGIRRGIENAIATKREATSIVEAISAEDIGKLPDVSIAESLARLPGVAAQRVNGQAQQLSIRGTSGDLSTITLNGREQVSTSPTRIVEYDQYPAELISAATVYKTGDAALVGQGLSGTVDLQTVNPLAFPGRTLSVYARGERNSHGSESVGSASTGNRFSMSYIDQFADRTIGVAFGVAHAERPTVNNFFETWNWVPLQGANVPAGTLAPQGIKALAITGDERRDGLIGVVTYRPSKNFTSTLDAYYSKFNYNEARRGVEVPFESWSGATFSNVTIKDGLAVAGTINASPVIRNNWYDKESSMKAFGWNNKFTSGSWTAIADISHSDASIHENLVEVNASRGAMDINYNYAAGGDLPTYAFTQSLSDPNAITIGGKFGDGYVNVPSMTDKLNAARFSVKREFDDGMISSVEAGINYSKRDKVKQHLETGFNKITGNFAANNVYGPQDLSMLGFPSTLQWDIQGVLHSNFGAYTPAVLNPWGATKNWSLTEKVTTGYAKLNIDTSGAAVPVTGNVGVQVVHTDQSSSSLTLLAWPFASLVPLTDGKTYNDVLPSLNLAANFSDNQVVRLGLGKSVARAKIDQLNAARAVGLSNGNTGTPWGNGGNAQLDPWRATYADLSYEKYFGKKGYVSVAGFYKDLKSYIYNLTTPYDFSSYNLAGATTNMGTFTRPLNGQGGKLQGLEAALSIPLDMVSPMLDGFGVVLNASHNDSAITIKDQRFGDQAIPLPGLSKNVYNLTGYYEKNGFSARISERHRSDFVGEIGGPGGVNELTFVKADDTVDAQVAYDFNSGWMKGMSLQFMVNNLTDTAFQTYSGYPNRPRGYQKYGRQFLVGVSFKL